MSLWLIAQYREPHPTALRTMITEPISRCPVLNARATLPELVATMLRGLALLTADNVIISYTNIKLSRGMIGITEMDNIHCDLQVIKDCEDKYLNVMRKGVWLASIPRPSDSGIFSVQGRQYYTVMRLRLSANVPMCTLSSSGSAISIETTLRSENLETLESVRVGLRRAAKKPHNLVLVPNLKDSKPLDAMSVLRTMLSASQYWADTVLELCKLLRASATVLTMIRAACPLAREVVLQRCYFPSTLNPATGEHYYVRVGGCEVATQVIVLCQMMIRHLSVECGEAEGDDQDDYANSTADTYAVMMCRLLRKRLRMLGTGVIHSDGESLPKVFIPMADAIISNDWEVMEKRDTDLKISRQLNLSSSFGIVEATRELVVYASSKGYSDSGDVEQGRRLLHKSQDGFICKIRTSDDANAGLKMYLAADCYVSRETKLFSMQEDNIGLRRLYYETRNHQSGDCLWMHNHRVIGAVELSSAISVLEDLRDTHKELCWSHRAGVLESRYCYGRFLRELSTLEYPNLLLDTRSEAPSGIIKDASRYSSLCYEVPFYHMMPVPRSVLATKIIQKAASYETPLNAAMSSLYLAHGQRPLIRTAKSTAVIYGNNALVCYTTLNGLGVEDGIVLNQRSVQRGLFSTLQRISIEWIRRDELQVKRYSVDVDRGAQIKQGVVLCSIICVKGNGEEVVSRMKHDKPYRCQVEDVTLCFEAKRAAAKDLLSIKVLLRRHKIFSIGDKLSSRYGQKAVAVKVMREEDMPVLHNEKFPSAPDIVIDPLSMLSRATMSQDLSSALGLRVLELGASEAVTEPFGATYIQMGRRKKLVDIRDIDGEYCAISDGTTGLLRDGLAKVGFEYYLVLDHIADTKCRVTGVTKRDDSTGTVISSRHETSIRYNWQELCALMHSKSYGILSSIYNAPGVRGSYPFCSTCNEDVDAWDDGRCELCGNVVDAKVQLAKPFATAKSLLRCLDIDCYVKT